MIYKKAVCLCSLFLMLIWLSGCAREAVWENTADQTTDTLISAQVQQTETTVQVQTGSTEMPETEPAEVHPAVHVCGAVQSPGVYELPANARVADAVAAAGGFTELADTDWCNQARYVTDQEQIRIYTLDETAALRLQGLEPEEQAQVGTGGNADIPEAEQSDGKVNINTASADELKTLHGIGERRAEAIISYREQFGMFENIEQIKLVSGIGQGIFNNICNDIKV